MAAPGAPDPDQVMTRADLVRQLNVLRVRAAVGTGKARMSVRDVARATGIPRSTLAGYLSGTTPAPPDALGRIVAALGVEASQAAAWVSTGRRLAETADRQSVAIAADTGGPAGPAAGPARTPAGPQAGGSGRDPAARRPGDRPGTFRKHGRRWGAAGAALVGLIAAGAVAIPLVARHQAPPAPVWVTRVHSSVTGTPDHQGRIRVRYCPATDPCRFPVVPRVLVTGGAPNSGGGIPAGLVAFNATTTDFTLRVLDQRGRPVVRQVQVWYHAAVAGGTATEEVGTATARTDADGFATLAYARADRGMPTAVVVSAVQPSGGSAIPASIVVVDRGRASARFRVFSHLARPVARTLVTVAYAASWGAGSDSDGYATRVGTTTVTTDAGGLATIAFGRPLRATPDGVQVVGVAPAGEPLSAGTVVAHTVTEDGFIIRALSHEGIVLRATRVTVSYQAAAGVRSGE
jgi:hypothetical protein